MNRSLILWACFIVVIVVLLLLVLGVVHIG
jgi:hypothetical protein